VNTYDNRESGAGCRRYRGVRGAPCAAAMPKMLAVAFLTVVSASAAIATVSRIGPEFRINITTDRGQGFAETCSTPSGEFVVVWQGYDEESLGVLGQRYDALGVPAGSEFQVNSYTTEGQWQPSVCCHDRGFVVTWTSSHQDGHLSGIFGQRFDASGSAAGDEFQVNENWTSAELFSAVACDDDGRFFAVWKTTLVEEGAFVESIFGRRFEADGAPLGGDFALSTTRAGVAAPHVAVTPDGGFVAVWAAIDETQDVYARRYDAAGDPLGPEFRVNSYTTGEQDRPRVSSGEDGAFVVVWDTYGAWWPEAPDLDDTGVFGRRFAGDGTPIGPEFQINSYTHDFQARPHIAHAESGFIIVWGSLDELQEGGQDGDGAGVFGQVLDFEGERIGSEFQANTYTTNSQGAPTVAALPDGEFVVAWQSDEQDGSQMGIFGQRFTLAIPACGDPNGDGRTTATDALHTLHASVGTATCAPCVCDVNHSDDVTATDALFLLRVAVGMPLIPNCPVCAADGGSGVRIESRPGAS
jgi:hypothetical protein